jgi:hypothetical protein
LQEKLVDAENTYKFPWVATLSTTPKGFKDTSEMSRLISIEKEENRLIVEKYGLEESTLKIGMKCARAVVQKSFEEFLFKNWIPKISTLLTEEGNKHIESCVAMGLPICPRAEYDPLLKVVKKLDGQSCDGSMQRLLKLSFQLRI